MAAAAGTRYVRRLGKGLLGIRNALVVCIVIPTLLSVVYYLVVATPRYVSEAQFIVRGVNSTRISGFEALFRTFGVSRQTDDANIIQNYVHSRDALAALSKTVNIKQIFSQSEGDFLTRYPRFWETDTQEGLYEFYRSKLRVVNDANRGITIMSIDTYKPEDARLILAELLRLSETVVNRINDRAQSDAVTSADREVDIARRNVIDAQLKLSEFRKAAILVDPVKNSTSALETITVLSNEMALSVSQLQEMTQMAPSNPAIETLKAKVASLRERINAERQTIAGDDQALSAKVSTYERLTLNRDMADKILVSATQALENARAEARRQHLYIERVAEPSLPDEPTEPKRARMIFTVFLTSVMAYCVYWVLSVGAKEHAQ